MNTNWPTKRIGEIFEPIFMDVERDASAKILNGDKKEEDHITGDIFTRLEERINQQEFGTMRVHARQFSGRGPNSDESLTGADGALIVEAPELELRKFFIFQAKKNPKFDERAIEQKWRMLSCTPDSFFLVYGKKQFQFVSAFLVSLNDGLEDLPTKSFSELHKDFFNCFIGDHFFGFPPLPFQRPWRFWAFFEEFRDFTKLSKDSPLAKNNLLIQIERMNTR